MERSLNMKFAPALCAILLAGIGSAAQAADEPSFGNRVTSTDAVAKSRSGSFDVFIDQATGFAFVNTPNGWKFIRKIQDPSGFARQEESPSKPLKS